MTYLLWSIAILTLVFFVFAGGEMAVGGRRFRWLENVEPTLPPHRREWPLLSVVIAGRNEERNIEHALSSVLSLDYPSLELIFVNDRSTDRTGEVMRRMAERDSRVKVTHVESLPPGWLGKNHALHEGARAARGEWILFTDADVVFEPTTLRRAIAFAESRELGHLTTAGRVTGPTLPLRVFIAAFGFFFLLYSRPWRAASHPDPKYHVGIGAFNLVRADIYRRAGGHEPIRMRPDDDMMLGKLMKMHGAKQELVVATSLVNVEWYPTVREAVRGLEKNGFTGVSYSIPMLVAATFSQLIFNVWPFVAAVVTTGPLRTLNAVIVALMLLLWGALCWRSFDRPLYALGFPFATIVFLYALWNSAVRAIANDGIDWRGTHYPLDELKRNKI